MKGQTFIDLGDEVRRIESEADGIVEAIRSHDNVVGFTVDIGWANGFYVEVQWMWHMGNDEWAARRVERYDTLTGALRQALAQMDLEVEPACPA